jgi:peptide deformylase
MALLTIKDEGAEILRQKAREVSIEEIQTDVVQKKVDEMIETLEETNGLGLSACQIGSDLAVFVMKGRSPIVIFNPKIIARNGKATSHDEGCLSVPGERVSIRRSKHVIVTGQDREGNELRFKTLTKREAFVVQHEMDHLNGILIIDH